MRVVIVERVAVEGWHVAWVHRRGRGPRDRGVGAIGVAIGRLLGRATMAEGARWWCPILRSSLVEHIGIEETLVERLVTLTTGTGTQADRLSTTRPRKKEELATYFLLCILRSTRTLYAIATLDHVGLEAYRTWSAVEFEEEPAGIAQDGADLISSPERGG
jgi:hypothetical protein